MAARTVGSQWEGKATAEIRGLTADQVWPLIADFCNFHKWCPIVDACHKVEGVDGRPGLVRYCTATLPPPSVDGDGVVKWCHEKLLEMDSIERRLSYQLLENNMGIKACTATLQVAPIADTEGGGGGCRIEWSFAADPIEGRSREELVAFLEKGIEGMARKIEEAF